MAYYEKTNVNYKCELTQCLNLALREVFKLYVEWCDFTVKKSITAGTPSQT